MFQKISKGKQMAIKIFRNIGTLLSLKRVVKKDGRHILEKDLGIARKQTLVSYKNKILWVGSEKNLSSKIYSSLSSHVVEIDLRGRTVMPSFVESHTHLIYAGDRKSEFELRNQGMSYSEIAQRGGGILSTVKLTRKASHQDLLERAQKRAESFIKQGVTTLEVKSGYALDLKNEIKMLRVAKELKKVTVVPTFLGAHAIPKEYKNAEVYTDYLINKVLPMVKKDRLADRVDMFIDQGYFSKQLAEKYFQAAKELGFNICAHTEQIKRTRGYQVLLQFSGLSGDHLVQLNENDVQNIAQSGLTAVLLPAADFYLQMKYPPARHLIDKGARVALATDFNPGSSPTQDLSLVGVLARLNMKMTLPEVIGAYTWSAAKALGRDSTEGSIEQGKMANFVVLNDDWDSLFYQVGYHPVGETWRMAKKTYKS